jgi:hypothetical protein
MIKLLFIGLWVCLITLGSSYAAAYWAVGQSGKEEELYLEGLEYRKLPIITVPMISDGAVQGYVVVKLVYTADAALLHEMSVEPDSFVTDEAFREIYTNGVVQFGKLSKYNINEITIAVKEHVNKRLAFEVVQDILVEGLNYIEKDDMRRVAVQAMKDEAKPAKAEETAH